MITLNYNRKKLMPRTLLLALSFVLIFPARPTAESALPLPGEAVVMKAPDATRAVDPLKEKITLDYKDTDLATILRSFSYTYGLNLVTSTEVKGKITVSLRDVTIAEALDVVLSANGYNYTQRGNIIYVTPGSSEGAQLVSEPVSLNYIKAGDAQNLLRKALSPKGDIKVDEIFNILVVTDYPANITKLKQLLASVDQAPQQVLIEAKIVDITSKDLQNLGVTWQIDYNPLKGMWGRATQYQERMKGTGSFAGPSSQLSGGQLKIDTFILKGLTASATIDALIQDQKANLLAAPSIAVLNNREARIIIGEKVPYKERTQTTTGTTETTKFVDVGTTLRVIPSINSDGYITMVIHPEVSSVAALLDAGPRITTREADTMVRVKEGETIIIGGLIKQEDNRIHSRVPVLGYIPLFGNFFGSRSKDQTQTELTVFITPKILRSREEMYNEGRNRYQEEAFVNIMATGNLSVQKELFDKAYNLEHASGLESRRKDNWQLKNQALSIYESIVSQFPDGPIAPEAAFRAARIYYKDINELYRARELCAIIISAYPNDPFAIDAKDMYKEISIVLEKERIRKLEQDRKSAGKRAVRPAEKLIRAEAEDTADAARAAEQKKFSKQQERAEKAEKQARQKDESRQNDEAQIAAQEEERLRKKEQEAALKAKEEADAARAAKEGAAKKAKEEAAAAQKAKEEAAAKARVEAEAAKKAKEEAAQKTKDELAAQKKAKEEEAKKQQAVRMQDEKVRKETARQRVLDEQKKALQKKEELRQQAELRAKEEKKAKEEAAREAKQEAEILKTAKEEADRLADEKAGIVRLHAEKKAQVQVQDQKLTKAQIKQRESEAQKAAKQQQEEDRQQAQLRANEEKKAKEEARLAAIEEKKKQEAAALEVKRKAAVELAAAKKAKEETRLKAIEEQKAKEAAAAKVKEEARLAAIAEKKKQETIAVEARRKADEEAAQLKKIQVELQKQKQEEARGQARLKAEEEKKVREAAARKAKVEAEVAAKAREEARLEAVEEKKKQEAAALEAKRKAAQEAAAAKKAKEEARIKAIEEQKAKEAAAAKAKEEARLAALEIKKRQEAAAAEAQRRAAEKAESLKLLKAELQRQAEEKARKAEEEANRKVEEKAQEMLLEEMEAQR